MRRTNLTITIAVLCLAGCSGSKPMPRGVQFFAPSHAKIVALDIAANRMDSEKGQLASAREYAAPDAVTFVPEPKKAMEYYASDKATWDTPFESDASSTPRQVILSCDGKTGIIAVEWKNKEGDTGFYTAAWQYFQKNAQGDGKWLWTLWHGVQMDENIGPPAPPTPPPIEPVQPIEMVTTRTASCKGKAPASLVAPAEGEQMKQLLSIDQSLQYSWRYRPDRSRVIEVKIWNGTAMETVLRDEVAPEKTEAE